VSAPEDITIIVPAALASKDEWDRVTALPRLHEPGAHACPVAGCAISSEEHHRISFGYMTELKALRRRVADLENGTSS
jgi:hypothetical protein